MSTLATKTCISRLAWYVLKSAIKGLKKLWRQAIYSLSISSLSISSLSNQALRITMESLRKNKYLSKQINEPASSNQSDECPYKVRGLSDY